MTHNIKIEGETYTDAGMGPWYYNRASYGTLWNMADLTNEAGRGMGLRIKAFECADGEDGEKWRAGVSGHGTDAGGAGNTREEAVWNAIERLAQKVA